MAGSGTEYYERQFVELQERLVRILGAPTVTRLLERAVTEIRSAHPALGALRSDETIVDFEGVRARLDGQSEAEIRDTFTALNAVLLLLVARLLGREIAQRLTEGIPLGELLASHGLGRE